MNKFLLLPVLAFVIQIKSIELIIATQELNFNRVSQIIDSRNYTSQERQQALNYVNRIIAEKKISKPWYKKYRAWAKLVTGAACAAAGYYIIEKTVNQFTTDDLIQTDDTIETGKQTILGGKALIFVSPVIAYSGVAELCSKYSADYNTALAIKALLI